MGDLAKTRTELLNEVLNHLGDTELAVWTAAEVISYLDEGYKRMAESTLCFWDIGYIENLPYSGSYTASWEADYKAVEEYDETPHNYNYPWELDYCAGYVTYKLFDYCYEWELAYLDTLTARGDFTAHWEVEYATLEVKSPDWVYYNQFNYTHDWEINYIDNGIGPANHSYPWEWQDEYVDTEYIRAVAKLPTDFYRMDRATNDWSKIDPHMSATLEVDDRVYETQQGKVIGYLMDKDGLRTIRKYKVPNANADYYDVTGDWGILRDPSDITSDSVNGSWGIPRCITGEHPIGPYRWGLPRRVYQDGGNFRIEYFRRGRPVESGDDEYEMPDAYCKYLRHYAMNRALAREGAGQDLKLAAHYEERWLVGLKRMGARQITARVSRTRILGARKVVRGARPPKPVLPWEYGRVVR